jgi:hypothetical protein
MLVMGADNASPSNMKNPLCGEPVSGIWMGKTDDLWNFGKPGGWGGPWWKDEVEAGETSDPYLMTGFDQKVVHLTTEPGKTNRFTIEVDVLGCGEWRPYREVDVSASGYACHCFEPGFSAHWVRVTAAEAGTVSAQFYYT